MVEKKEEIMQTAMQSFSEKGYFSTSVQEIADDCGIAKGSIYKYFNSKEHLLISIIEYNNQKMLERAMNINLKASLSAKEKLIQKTDIELRELLDNKGFITMLSNSIPDHENEDIIAHIRRARAAMVNWHKESLLQTYGNTIQTYVWDLVMMFEGTLKEYLFLMAHEHKPIETYHTAQFVINQLDTMIQHTRHPVPVLTTPLMKEYEEYNNDWHPESFPELMFDLLQQMKAQIKDTASLEMNQQDLLSALDLLQQEVQGQKPRCFLIEALLAYLEKEKSFTSHVGRMKAVLRAWYDDNH